MIIIFFNNLHNFIYSGALLSIVPRIKYAKQLNAIRVKPVFGVKDLEDAGVPRAYARQRLHKLEKSGAIYRIERGKYTESDSALLVATHLTHPSYLALWSALSVRGLTTQIPFAVQVVTSRKRFNRSVTFMGSEIRFYSVRPSMMFGYENMVFDSGQRIQVAKPEKIIIDALYLGAIPINELTEALEVADTELLESYVKLARNRSVREAVRGLMRC
jgi:predicted transcriptional regulator of viral defense system